jgi:hypothetical protein
MADIRDWLVSYASRCTTPRGVADHVTMAAERIAELEAVLREIAEGQTDEGGNRRNHPNATAMARQLFKLE